MAFYLKNKSSGNYYSGDAKELNNTDRQKEPKGTLSSESDANAFISSTNTNSGTTVLGSDVEVVEE